MNLYQLFRSYLDRFLTPIDNPGSRLFYVNILTTIFFVVLYAIISVPKESPKDRQKRVWRWMFSKKYWWNHSSKLDYQIYFINGLLKTFIFIPWLDCSYFFSKYIVRFLQNYPQLEGMSINNWNLLSFTILAFMWDDFLRFFHHYLMHKIPWLWKFHQTHHSARVITPMTLYRTHPVEVMLSTIRNSISSGVTVGCFVYLFNSQVSYFNIMTVNFFSFAFNFLGSNLRHSHIPLSFGFMEKVFISPKQHQIHHSNKIEHFDKNFGVSLTLWDILFNSRVYSKDVSQKLHFGVKGIYKHRWSDVVWKAFW